MTAGGDPGAAALQPPAKLALIGFRAVRKNTLRGFVSVEFGSGLRLFDCAVHVHPTGRAWVALPGKPVLDEDGRHKRDVNGKPTYVPIAEWRDRATSDRFCEIVIAQLRER